MPKFVPGLAVRVRLFSRVVGARFPSAAGVHVSFPAVTVLHASFGCRSGGACLFCCRGRYGCSLLTRLPAPGHGNNKTLRFLKQQHVTRVPRAWGLVAGFQAYGLGFRNVGFGMQEGVTVQLFTGLRWSLQVYHARVELWLGWLHALPAATHEQPAATSNLRADSDQAGPVAVSYLSTFTSALP